MNEKSEKSDSKFSLKSVTEKEKNRKILSRAE